MFKCDNCGKQTEVGEKTHTVNIFREKEYTHFKLIFDKNIRKKKKEFYTTIGYESVSELQYCVDCFEKTNQGELVNGNEERSGRSNQTTERRSPTFKNGSEINGSNTRRIV